MGHKKLKRFAEIETFPNVFQYPGNMQGRWHGVFKNHNPIILELACGKGEYTIQMAEKYPERNFIGMDLKGNRIWKGAKYALDNHMSNVAFIRSQIEMIANYFTAAEADEIWLTFPDPQLQLSRTRKRLTHPRFLVEYEKILKPEGLIHLKTDSPDLYAFTREVIDWCGLRLITDMPDVYSFDNVPEDLLIKTYYESLDISGSSKVFYLCWSLPVNWNRDFKAFTRHYKSKYTIDEER